jgi:hypothetical protein
VTGRRHFSGGLYEVTLLELIASIVCALFEGNPA